VIPTHPALVHTPLGTASVLPLLALLLVGAMWAGWLPRRAYWLAVALNVVMLGSGMAAKQTGEAEEERVEDQVPHDAIEDHEHAADRFVIGTGVLLLVGLAGVLIRREDAGRWIVTGAALGTLVTAKLAYDVGRLGGVLVYVHDAAAAGPPAAQPLPARPPGAPPAP
jgi:hypothetical protein